MLDKLRYSSGKTSVSEVRKSMQGVMQRNCAVFRVEKTLQEGVQKMEDVYSMRSDIGIHDRGLVWNTDLVEGLELENLLL